MYNQHFHRIKILQVSHNISEAFCGSRQQDAHEWLQCLFEALDAELEAGAKARGLLKPISSSDQASRRILTPSKHVKSKLKGSCPLDDYFISKSPEVDVRIVQYVRTPKPASVFAFKSSLAPFIPTLL